MFTMSKAVAMVSLVGTACFMFQPAMSSEESPGQLDESALSALGASVSPGQQEGASGDATEPLVSQTTLTYRSHSISGGASAGNLEGNACPSGYTMVSGACHPGYNDRVIIINQYPNKSSNTWRCGFKNNNSGSRTVWIYTLCGK